jgi:hypothetical protein
MKCCAWRKSPLLLALLLVHLAKECHAGLFGIAAYGVCQSGCNALVVACYAAAGFTFGTVTAGTGIPAAVVGCNAGLGLCMAGCVAAGVGPI